MDFPGGSEGKESACSAGDQGSIPGLGRSPGESNGYPLQYSCLESSVDRGAWLPVNSPLGHKNSDMSEQLTEGYGFCCCCCFVSSLVNSLGVSTQSIILSTNRSENESESCSVVSDSLQPHGLLQSLEFSRPEH